MKNKIFGGIFIFFIVLFIYAANWVGYEFGNIPFSQMLFHLMCPMDGVNNDYIFNFLKYFIPILLLILFIAYIPFYQFLEKWKKVNDKLSSIDNKFVKIVRMIRKAYNRFFALIWGIVFVIATWACMREMGIDEWIKNQFDSSSIYEDYYVDSSTVEITFPEKKKNLIYIIVESYEATFADQESGGAMKENLIPNLTELALSDENTHFSTKDNIAGAYEIPGSSWTIAGMVCQTSGVPLMLPIEKNSYGYFADFLPGITSLGQILKENGYVNEVMLGSDSTFSGLDKYYSQHGDYIIYDHSTAVEKGYIEEDYDVFWGFEDAKLFSYAKEEVSTLAGGDKPFNLMINTIDTHTLEGYRCGKCKYEHGHKYEDVISCLDRQIYEFIEWAKTQDFYEDTVIIVQGDHNSMSRLVKEYMTEDGVSPDDYTRTTYNVIINSDVEAENTTNRDFATIDLFPTTLASLGCTIEGDRLGLGTNLYSDTPTLMEEMGVYKFMEEIAKNSKFYNREILQYE